MPEMPLGAGAGGRKFVKRQRQGKFALVDRKCGVDRWVGMRGLQPDKGTPGAERCSGISDYVDRSQAEQRAGELGEPLQDRAHQEGIESAMYIGCKCHGPISSWKARSIGTPQSICNMRSLSAKSHGVPSHP